MVPWSQNFHFVTKVPLTRTGVLYPRVRDFFIQIFGCEVRDKTHTETTHKINSDIYFNLLKDLDHSNKLMITLKNVET